ncbi:aminomethyl transferase family protein [Arthrobacter sp. CAU 1506]|uniref:aminomethyltransferase family protein n=1 Tax=Arthrobacter sp. CAU 1506 TaxID=2560052 RepID=UPI0010ACAEF8|nr:aminomethyltransferase family protein [Arthrobacter sp. CAU 1506]TJY66105.1 aminomethyl transferase family protein [Arthrobacter sp. CAU 1506]
MSASTAIAEGVFTLFQAGPRQVPFEYEGARSEILASKTTAHICTALHGISPVYDVSGPEALEFLRSVCVNSLANFEVGQIRHAVLCNEKGQILTDGVLARISEDTYRSYWLAPVLEYRLLNSTFDVQGTDRTSEEFFIQVAGPRSLEILEQAAGEDLHDIRFARHRVAMIAGVPVRIIRLGMAGGLAYELHGDMEDTEAVYRAIWEAGQRFGMKKLGQAAYMMQHTEAGFPNINLHYPLPWYEDPDLAAFFDTRPHSAMFNKYRELVGSVGNEIEDRFVTPLQVGWRKLVDFNHEFVGREALLKAAETDDRTAVTLVWNEEDVADIFASQFRGRDVEPYDSIDERLVDMYFNTNGRSGFVYHADWVLDEKGDRIGTSTGRINSVFYRRMISIGFVSKKHVEIGQELTVVWGRPGTPQKKVRATVARVPFFDLVNNNEVDVETIPHPNLEVLHEPVS